jgi:hypothetical protein
MKPKCFIICTPSQLNGLTSTENPLDYAYFNGMTILDEEDARYEYMCEYRQVANSMDQEKRAARRQTARFNKKDV